MNLRHAHILGLMSLAVASFGVAAGSELRMTAIMAGLLAAAAVATVVYECRPARSAAAATTAAPKASLVTTKRLLMLMLAIGIVTYGTGAGTFSSFSAETSNTNSAVASGTLALSDTINSGTACFSTSALSKDNYQAACPDALFSLTNQAPGVFGGLSKVTVANTGSLDASQLYVYAPYVNATLATQITSGTTISTLSTTALEGSITSGDTIEVDYGGTQINMVASANVSPTKTSIAIANPGALSGTLVNGSATVTLASTTTLRAGMSVTGTNIPANTTIASVTNATTIILSNNATGAGAQSLTFSVVATTTLPVGTRIYDASSNTISGGGTRTDCFDTITQTSPVVGANAGKDLNFNGTDIADGSHWDSTNTYCKTLLFFIQEQSNPTPSQAATTTNASTTVTVADSTVLSVGMSVTGTNIPANTTIASIPGGTTSIVLSQAATAGSATTLTFTVNYCWSGQGSSLSTLPTVNGMCYAPISAAFPGSGTTTINTSSTLITFASALQGDIKSGDILTISEPKKFVVTCTAGQDAFINSPSVTVSGCTSAAPAWVPATGESFDGATASGGGVIPATIVDTTILNGLNSDTTDTISNFDTSKNHGNQVELPPVSKNGTHVASGGGVKTLELAKHGSTGDTRVFYVGAFFPGGSGTAQNATQGLAATFGLSWNIAQ